MNCINKILSIRAARLPRTCKGAELTLIQGFSDLHLSLPWLPAVITDEGDRITTHLAIDVDLFLAEITETWPDISCEVQG